MTNKEFTKLLKDCRKHGDKFRMLLDKCREECVSRHGVDWSDVDNDWIIDSLDYGSGEALTARSFDKSMKEYSTKFIIT